MNSEELEQSLRAEFESYLKGVLAKMREDVTEFQKQIESEVEKHRSQISDAFRSFSDRLDNVPDFEGGFRESVIEHLRLARDEGAQITATAMAEAEDLERASAPAAFDLNEIKEALNDISSKDTQSSILKSLIEHASKYTHRGAFFIIKNEHFAGWKVFGKEAGNGETAIRDIHFPIASDSILGAAVRSLDTVEASFGTYESDSIFLDPIHFGQPDRMYAIPLIARGHGVAVLYSDYGHEGVTVNTDALEMLVKVAGLTVELLASAKAAQTEALPPTAPPEPAESSFTTDSADSFDSLQPVQEIGADEHAHVDEPSSSHGETADETVTELHSNESQEPADWRSGVEDPQLTQSGHGDVEPHVPTDEQFASFDEAVNETPVSDFDFQSQFDLAPEYASESSTDETKVSANDEGFQGFVSEPVTETISELERFEVPTNEGSFPETDAHNPLSEPISLEKENDRTVEATDADMVFEDESSKSHDILDEPHLEDEPASHLQDLIEPEPFDHVPSSEATAFDSNSFDSPVAHFETTLPPNGGYSPVGTPVLEAPPRPAATRLSDRNVDLPIEVAEDERRLHNDARRFARLLVSEIKLYNEKKVQEGRESSDLYERLREAIDRSRDMYDKRVQPPVASKFDYFHYELVNSLAEGNESRLGKSYKGASI
ncbi:MAG: hypothetical protein ABJA02_00630 [Acidobacteriota bacterium]